MKTATKFCYLTDPNNYGVKICIARKLVSVDEKTNAYTYEYGWAMNNYDAGDYFNKKLARRIAEGRMTCERTKQIITVYEKNSVIKEITKELSKRQNYKLEPTAVAQIANRVIANNFERPAFERPQVTLSMLK